MKMILDVRFALLTLCIFAPAVSDAGYIVSLGTNLNDLPSSGGTVKLTASIVGGPGDILTSYDLPIDVAGISLPADASRMSFTSPTALAFSGATVPLSNPVAPNAFRDFGYSGAGLSASFVPLVLDISSAKNLFSVDLVFGANALPTPVMYDINFATADTGFLGLTINGVALSPAELAAVEFRGTSITLAAVPEPGSTALLLAMGFAGIYRRRRKSKSESVTI